MESQSSKESEQRRVRAESEQQRARAAESQSRGESEESQSRGESEQRSQIRGVKAEESEQRRELYKYPV